MAGDLSAAVLSKALNEKEVKLSMDVLSQLSKKFLIVLEGIMLSSLVPLCNLIKIKLEIYRGQ